MGEPQAAERDETESPAPERDQVRRETAQRILEATDRARRKLARDLHDGAQQQFVTSVINLQIAQANMSSDPERARTYLDKALRQSKSGLEALSEFVSGIHPPILTHLGLNAAIGSLADGAPIPVDLDITMQRLPSAVEESVYFLISEALTNVIKHAGATTAAIQIRANGLLLTVTVSDDGVGGATMTGGGSGLMGMADRANALGGTFVFTSPPAGGTVVRAAIPLPAGQG